MNHLGSTDRRQPGGSDSGVALISAVALVALTSILIVVMVSVAMREATMSGKDRQRSSAVMVAEAQVDSAIATIQGAAPTALPCGTITPTPVSVKSDVMAIENVVKYYDAAGVEVPCSALATTKLAQATIKSTTTSNAILGEAPARRSVETLLRLTESRGNGLDKAIFGNAGVSLANKADIYGQNGQPDADLYTNGSVTCNNNQNYHGSIYAQGTVSMASGCVVDVDVVAKNGFSATNNNATVKGRILVSNGNITLNGASLGQQARASGTVTSSNNGACSIANKCFPGQAVDAPAYQAFPQLSWNAATKTEWVSNGYTNYVEFSGSQCGMLNNPAYQNITGQVDNVAFWMIQNMGSVTTPTLIYANCPGQPVKFQKGGLEVLLNANLAIFSTAGFNFSNSLTIKSKTNDQHSLYMIQPYNAASQPCTYDGISLDNQVTIESTIDDLLYSPCNIRKANQTTHYGQIYAGGEAKIDNSLTMFYKPLPVFGLVTPGGSVNSYTADILYKRENL